MNTEEGAPRESALPAALQPMSIIADEREHASAVLAEVRIRPEFDVRVRRLSVGDYLIDHHFLFERKTLPDLVGSVIAGRLFSQDLRLAEVSDYRPALVLEGTAKDLQGSRMRWEALQVAIPTKMTVDSDDRDRL